MLKAEADGSTALTMPNALIKAVESNDVTVYTNVDVTTLIQDENGKVIGVKGNDATGKEITFKADATLLATGGLHGSQRVDGTGLDDSFGKGYVAGNVIATSLSK